MTLDDRLVRQTAPAAAPQKTSERAKGPLRRGSLQPEDIAEACMFVIGLPERAHVSELMIQPAKR